MEQEKKYRMALDETNVLNTGREMMATKRKGCRENGIFTFCEDCVYGSKKDDCADNVRMYADNVISMTTVKVDNFMDSYGIAKKNREIVLQVVELFFKNKGIEYGLQDNNKKILVCHSSMDVLTENEEIMKAVLDLISELGKVL